MANKVQFPDGFNPKGIINDLDKILIADAVSGQPFITTLVQLTGGKVDKESGKSLVLDTLITKLSADYSKEQIDTIVSGINTTVASLTNNKVEKESGKSLVLDTLITKLSADYSKEEIDGIVLALQSSINDITNKLNLIKTDGDGNKYLAEDGTYKTVIVPDAPVQSISLNGEPIAPDASGNVNVNVVVDVEQTIDPTSTNPVSSSAVASEFAQLSAKYATAVQLQVNGEDENKTYAINLLDENGEILSTTDEFSGGGGGNGGEVATTKVILTKTQENVTVKQGDNVVLGYYFDHRDNLESSTGLPANVSITISAGANVNIIERVVQANTTNSIDVTKFLIIGTNNIRIRASVDNGENVQVSTINYRVQVVNLRLTSNFDYSSVTTKGTNITVPYYLTGSGSKVVSAYVNGVKIEDRTVTSSTSAGSFSIPTNTLNHGTHSIQLVAELYITDTQIIKSNSIYFGAIVKDAVSNTPIIGTRFENSNGVIIGGNEQPFLTAKQFEDYVINYVGYHPTIPTNNVTIVINDEVIQSINTTAVQRQVTNKQTLIGTYSAYINVGTTRFNFTINVGASGVNLTEPIDNMTLKLSAQGRSNNEENRNSWNYKNITSTISNVQYSGDGWVNNALRLINGGQAVINHKPLTNTNNGFAFTTRFKATNVNDVSKVLFSCMLDGVGFIITAEEVTMVANGNSSVSMKLASGEIYNIALVSFPIANMNSSDYEKLNTNMMFLYINGIMSGGVQKGNNETLNQSIPSNIEIKGEGATLDVYNLRTYNSFLTDSQVLDIHMLDMDNVDDIINKYNENDILDNDGNVTVESVPNDMRYVIITGTTSNMTTVAYAQMMNNKDTRYAVDEILHIKKSEPNLNFKCVGGCLRIQGTSSLAYPIKNFRFYFRSASSSSIFGDVYTGVDTQGNGGTLITEAKPKISFKNANKAGKRPSPVNVWCLKADYAESSSSHNTGMAVMANDVFIASGSPTPAQKHVLPSHPYDVRTTVDGEPCYLFARNTINDVPVFIGKFNLNNDKSTEEVFGFTDIPGYHKSIDGSTPSTWITEKFNGVNPTECWEFRSNDTAMGSYLDDDFDIMDDFNSPRWMKTFESRYPDNNDTYLDGTKKPVLLQTFVTWVKSTLNNKTKFRNELANYMDVKHLCKYFAITQLMGAVDQIIKNAMLGFWYSPEADKMLGYYIFYDNDTTLGLRNDGRLLYDPFIDRNTIDPETGSYAYMGHESVLWNNLETEFANEIRDAYVSLRAVMNNQFIIDTFGKNQSEKFSERIYNIDALNKYITPKSVGVPVLINGEINTAKYSYMELMQGSRSSHRKWWLTNRLSTFDARYGTGGYLNNALTWKGTSLAGATIKATPSKDYYFQLRRESNIQVHQAVKANVEWSYGYPDNANIGTIFTFYGADFTKKLNVSNWGGFTDLTLPNLPVLEELILGKTGKTYGLTELVIGTKMPMLKKLDITNYTAISNLDLSASNKVETVIANGCTLLTSINIAEGSPITLIELPNSIKTLKLKGLPYLTNSGIIFKSGNSVDTLIIEDCPLIDWNQLFNTLGNIKNIRVTNINSTGDKALLDKLSLLNGVDEYGVIQINKPIVTGTIKISTFLTDVDNEYFKSKLPELKIVMPEWSRYTVHLGAVNPASISNDENGTGYNPDLIIQTSHYVHSGHAKKVTDSIHRYLGKHNQQGIQTIIQLDDNNSNYFKNGANAQLNGTNGDVWVKKPSFWYKGINDILNNKNYVYISSNVEKPTVGEHRKVISTDIQGISSNCKVNTTATTLSASILNDSKYDIAKINIPTGYTKVKLPMIPAGVTPLQQGNANVGSLFLGENDVIISKIEVSADIAVEGNYIIVNVPVNAKTIFHTYNKQLGIKDIIFFNGDIYNAEPEWVKSDEILINAFTLSVSNNKLKSASIVDGSGVPQKYGNSQSFYDALTLKAWDAMTIKDYNELNWLYVLKFGTFRIDNTVGTGVPYGWYNVTNRQLGLSASKGMKDTTNNGYYDGLTLVTNPDNHMSVFGIENLWGCDVTTLDNIERRYLNNTPVYTFLGQNSRTISFSPSYKSYSSGDDYYIKRDTLFSNRIYMELYLDTADVGRSSEGSSTTYLASRKEINLLNVANNGGVFPIWQYSSNRSGSGVGLFTWAISGNAGDAGYTQNRATWKRTIKEIQNPTDFNNLSELI